MKNLISELGYLGFEVSDLQRWELFATDVLGLACLPGLRVDTRLLRMDEYPYRFILCEGPRDDCEYAGWRTSSPVSVEAFGRHLDAWGVSWSWANDEELSLRGVARMLHFRDPGGNRHEIYSGPISSADPLPPSIKSSGFVTHGEGLGHIVYNSSAYADTLHFAQQVLGLGLTDTIHAEPVPGVQFDISFLHANSRHHSFALAPQLPTPGAKKKIHHFMIEVNSLRNVGLARDRCLEMGQPVPMDIGQHPNDRMISFYGETPSGFYVEYGYGGAKVDTQSCQAGNYDRISEWGHRPHIVASAHARPEHSETLEIGPT